MISKIIDFLLGLFIVLDFNSVFRWNPLLKKYIKLFLMVFLLLSFLTKLINSKEKSNGSIFVFLFFY